MDRWDIAYHYAERGHTGFIPAIKYHLKSPFFIFIEHGPVANNIPAIYTSLSFYYGEKHPQP